MSTKVFALIFGCLWLPYHAVGQGLIINEVMASNGTTLVDAAGDSGDWIELHNAGAEALQLRGYYLSDDAETPDRYPLPDRLVAPGGYVLVWADGKDFSRAAGEIHANFSISSAGEPVFLYDAGGGLADSSPGVALPTDISVGRPPSGVRDWVYFTVPTPAGPNDTPAFAEIAPVPICLPRGGIYSGTVEVGLRAGRATDTIRYTLDGTLPTSSSPVWLKSFDIGSNVVVRARSYRAGAIPSEAATASYLFDDTLSLPVMSLAVPPAAVFGDTGIYPQYWSGKEVPLNAEYFTADKDLVFSQGLGVKIHAPDRRDQKSLRLYARGRYGASSIDHPLFADTEMATFRRLVLRNGGNDGAEEGRLHVKDGYAHRLYKQLDPNYLAAGYQPVHTFINGEYNGIHNLRERQDEHYLESYTGYACDEVDYLEHAFEEPLRRKTLCGDWEQWDVLQGCLQSDSATLTTTNCDSVIATIDTTGFIDYQVFEIFIGNQDWLNNNIKFWKPKDHGQWQWILWDTEYGLGTQSRFPSGNPEFDFMRMALTWGGWGDGDYTWMLRNLIRNRPGFREQFATRYSDLLNTLFLPEYLDAELDTIIGAIEPDLALQLARYNNTQAQWDEHYLHTRDFILRRGALARSNLARNLEFADTTHALTLNVSDTNAGRIQVNTITIDDRLPGWQKQAYPWRGHYFPDLTTTLTALPEPGYRFVGWEGDSVSAEPTLSLTLSAEMSLTALFEAGGVRNNGLLINEVMSSNANTYTDASGAYPDWIELYNPTARAIEMAGMYISDDPEDRLKYRIPATNPAATTVPAGGYLVVFADGDTEQGAHHLPFRLSRSGEAVWLSILDADSVITVLDSIVFPELETDYSYGRLPNGGADWAMMSQPTPAAMNRRSTSVDGSVATDLVRVFPNPATDYLRVDLADIVGDVRINIADVAGRELFQRVARGGDVVRLEVAEIPSGPVVVTVADAAGRGLWRGVVVIGL